MTPAAGHVIIRCDASPAGGVGHLVRAISVAEAARRAGYSVILAGDVGSDLGRSLVDAEQLEVVDAHEDLGVLAAEQGATVVHVDHYDLSSHASEQVRRSGALLSSMEDGRFGRRPADVVVDSTVRAEVIGRPDDGSGTVLLGIRFAPMRTDVVAARERRAAEYRGPSDTVDVVVVMGGTDATGAAATVAAVCRNASGVGRVTVVAPAGHWEAVRAAAGSDVALVPPGPEFLARAAATDLVVSAAGTTSWELACLGTPSMLVAVVENQRAGYEAALAEGVARGLGTLKDVRENPAAAVARLEEAVSALLDGRSWAPAGRAMVDGHGAERIVEAWTAVLARGVTASAQVTARRAVPSDSLLLLRWRNDPVTRAVSRTTAAISWPGHSAWFERALQDVTRELYVVESDGVPVGTVRFDQHGDHEWEVSITLAPEARGRGLARLVLAAGEDAFLAGHDGVRLVAAVLPDNIASQRLFTGAGYAADQGRRDGDFDLLVRSAGRH